MKKLTKILSIVMVIIMLAVALSPIVFGLVDPTQVKAEATTSDSKITTIGTKVLSIITTIGIVISVVVIAGLGIKYITGSAEEKAEYKKSFMPLIVGIVVVTLALQIAAMIFSLT